MSWQTVWSIILLGFINKCYDICMHDFMQIHVFTSLYYIPNNGISGSYFFNSSFKPLRKSQAVCKLTAAVCNPNNVWRFQILYILPNTSIYFYCNHPVECKNILKLALICVSWWVIRLSILHMFDSSLCIFSERNVYANQLPSCFRVKAVVHIFHIYFLTFYKLCFTVMIVFL